MNTPARNQARDPRADARIRLLAWCITLFGCLVLLHRIGHGVLATPPWREPSRWQSWLDDIGPAAAFASIMRVGALVTAWYLAAVTMLGITVRIAHVRAGRRILDRLTIAPLRRLLASWVATTTAALAFTLPLPVARAGPPSPAPAPRPIVLLQVVSTDSAPPSVLLTVDDPLPGPQTISTEPPTPTRLIQLAPHATSPPSVAPPRPLPATVIVKPGDNFWSVARFLLSDDRGHPPEPTLLANYWRRLVDANRDRLVHADAPDLLFPGQELVVPPWTASGAP